MKITRLKTAVVEGNFDWTLVRIETDEGLQGLGECFFAPGLTTTLRALEPLLQGEDPRNIRRLFRKLQMAASAFRLNFRFGLQRHQRNRSGSLGFARPAPGCAGL